ncbi:CRISPR-associated endonuclease Cas2 [Ignavibacteria bacterium]|nr:CRISPR-associated endonuclease Cas2 [Bacteroidota bacterium]
MYYIAVYDIASEKRLPKMLKLCRSYLHHVQYSVFEGTLTPAALAELKHKAKKIMNMSEDSLIIYCIGNERWMDRDIIGVEKNSTSNFI